MQKGIEKMCTKDEQLVREVKSGNKEAFAAIVEKYYQSILNFMFHFLGDKELARDLAQECFIKLFQNVQNFRGESELKTYLYSIAKNLCFEHHRKAKAQPDFVEISELEGHLQVSGGGEVKMLVPNLSPLDKMISKESVGLILKAIRSLPVEQRVVFLLSEQQNQSYADIAKTLKCPIGTVASRKWQAVKSLKNRLQKVLKD